MTRFLAIAVLTCLMSAADADAQTPQTSSWSRPPDATLIARRQLGVLTYTKLTLRFDRTPARQAFETLRERLAIPMVGRYRDDPTADYAGSHWIGTFALKYLLAERPE